MSGCEKLGLGKVYVTHCPFPFLYEPRTSALGHTDANQDEGRADGLLPPACCPQVSPAPSCVPVLRADTSRAYSYDLGLPPPSSYLGVLKPKMLQTAPMTS